MAESGGGLLAERPQALLHAWMVANRISTLTEKPQSKWQSDKSSNRHWELIQVHQL